MKSLINWLRPRPNHPESIRRTWDRERARAMSPSHRDEIDAIFCAYVAWTYATAPDTLVTYGSAATGVIVTFPPPR